MDISKLISILENPPETSYPVILPDFFVDHFVLIPTFENFIQNLRSLASQGGGNLLDNRQFIRRGGNSMNTASALLALGINPKIIITTDEYGYSLLKSLAPPNLDLSHVHTDGRLSLTVSIETTHLDRKINLMISDSGSASSFKYSNLSTEDFQILENGGLIALVNLNHNQDGTDLARNLFTYIKETTHAKTFMDMGDPSSHPHLVKPLVNRVLKAGLVDILSVNENEVGWICWALSGSTTRKNLVFSPDEWLPAAKMISHETGVRVDLHTPQFAASITDDEVISVPIFKTESRVACGAGDSWNAGDIYGELLNLTSLDRLTLANATAALYVSSEDAKHPTKRDLIDFFLRKMK